MSASSAGLTRYYSNSRALLVGINEYKYAGQLAFAVNDAQTVANVLIKEFGFPPENVKTVLDGRATKKTIIREFHRFTGDAIQKDERIVFFFAGHGHTITGHRGEVGYLVPVDGRAEALDTLIRWDELTRNADLIPAKHVLFIMDACYGGLALARALPAGASRFLIDMLGRYSRQVLTAGKANEVVADSGGPIPNHSVFTGHLIEALRGRAAQRDGIISAQGVMAYVYEHVSRDQHSRQTPHFGHVDGDGDFIFAAPPLNNRGQADEKEGTDILMIVPTTGGGELEEVEMSTVDHAKQLLSEAKDRIPLHDLVAHQVRRVIGQTADDSFPVQGQPPSAADLAERLRKYEQITGDLRRIAALVGYWGEEAHRDVLRVTHLRLADRFETRAGLVVWLALRWYPLILTLYSCGIAAVAGKKYANLATVFLADVGDPDSTEGRIPLANAIGKVLLELNRADAFKQLPGHERNFVPRSEYLFSLLQPELLTLA